MRHPGYDASEEYEAMKAHLGARRLHAMDRSIRHTIADTEPMKVTTVCESCFQRITRELSDPYKTVAHFCSDCLSHGFDEAAA